jgi:hypothetical protein
MRINLGAKVASAVAVGTASILLCMQSGAVASAQPVSAGSHPTVTASTNVSTGSQDFAQIAQDLHNNYKPASASAKAQALAQVKRQITNGAIVVHLPVGAGLAAGGAGVVVGVSGVTVVSIPIQGGGLVAPSALVVQIGLDGAMHTSEVQAASTSATSGVLTSWIDGKLYRHLASNDNGTMTSANTQVPSATPAGTMKPMDWWDDFTKCLSDHGVPAWVAAAISAICGLAGVAVDCAIGVAVWYAGVIAQCYGA